MANRDRTVGVVVVGGLGVVAVFSHLLHIQEADETLWSVVFGVAVPLLLSMSVVAGGVWLSRSDFSDRSVARVAAWVVVGTVAMGVSGLLTVLYQSAEGVVMADRPFVVMNGATGGAVVGLIVGVYDERRRESRRRLLAERERSDLLVQQLTVLNRVLRHDLRNDVNVIRGYADMLVEGADDPIECGRTIRAKANDVVSLGERARKLEQFVGDDRDESSPVDLAELVDVRARELADAYPHATVSVDVVSPAWVAANPLLDPAVSNLLENALRHNANDAPELSATVRRRDDGRVEVRIVDDGPGIPDVEVRVLERGVETPLEHSDGIGLWLANWAVSASDGTISFDSDEEGGSAVVVRLPGLEPPADRERRRHDPGVAPATD